MHNKTKKDFEMLCKRRQFQFLIHVFFAYNIPQIIATWQYMSTVYEMLVYKAIAYASSDVSGEHAHARSHTREFVARTHKGTWMKALARAEAYSAYARLKKGFLNMQCVHNYHELAYVIQISSY